MAPNESKAFLKRIDDAANGFGLRAWVVLDGSRVAGKIHSRYTRNAVMRVDVYEYTHTGEDGKVLKEGRFSQYRAAGGGQDMLAAALRGAEIFGVVMYDHCGGKDPATGDYYTASIDRLREFGFKVVSVI